MERVEIPVDVYFKANDGKKFRLQEDCEKYERALDKWWNVRREFENVEGQLCYAYWVESKEELDEIIWLIHRRLNTSTCNYILRNDTEFVPQWIAVCPDYNEYNSEMAIRTLKEVRELTNDVLKAAQDTLSEITKLIWEKRNA